MIASFKAAMAERGYHAGKNIDYTDILIRANGRQAIEDIFAAIDSYQQTADLFITTSWVSLYTRSRLANSGIPQLFVPVLRSEALNMLSSLTDPPGTNVSGVYLMYPPEKILRLARLILPGITDYAYVFDSRIPADVIFRAAFVNLSPEERHGVAVHFIDIADGPAQALTLMEQKGVQAYGGIIGASKNGDALAASGLPVITALFTDLDTEQVTAYIRDSNIVAALFNPLSYCGRQAGEMSADILDDSVAIGQTIPRPARQVTFVNMKAANRMQVYIPFAALEAVDIVVR